MKKLSLIIVSILFSLSVFSQAGQKWASLGNTISTGEYFGTNNLAPIIFKTNSTTRLIIDESGNLTVEAFNTGQDGLVYAKSDGVLLKLPYTNSANDVFCGDGQFRDINNLSLQTGWKIHNNTIYSEPGFQIGIGTDTPGALLDVDGDAIVRGTLLVYNGIIVGKRYEGEKALVDTVMATKMETEEIKADEYKTNTITIDGNNSTITSTTGLVHFANNTIRANNMLTNDLHVYGTTSMDSLAVVNLLKIGNNSLYLSSDNNPAGVTNSIYTDQGALFIQSVPNYNQNTIINANNTGYVGIGTTDPQQNLHVRGETVEDGVTPNLSAVIRLEDEYTNTGIIIQPSGQYFNRTSYWDIAASAGRKGLFFTTDDGWGGSFVIMTLKEGTHNVGIGTEAPDERLHVARNDGWGVYSKIENNNGWTKIGFNTSHGSIESSARLQLNTESGEDVLIGGPFYAMHNTYLAVTDGQVGIGTTDPGNYKLAVEGNICARKVRVTEAPFWSDFVFESDYQLMSLEEVEAFIEQNGHLPGVPSAEEVESDGVDLLEMNAILLQKIEELTLYIIELEKKINDN